jgi:DNA-binding LacI/PurR family transcriptional regulator
MVVGDNTNPYFATMIKTVQMKLKEHNYSLVTFNNYENIEDELRFVTELCGLRVAGVLLSPAMGNSLSAELLKKNNIPYVFINRAPENTLDPYVMADDELAAYLATKHLIDNKKGKILFMNFYEGFITSKMRGLGYKRALREHDMEDEYTWIVSNCTDRKDGYDTMRELLKTHKPPFSVLCFSDYIAMGAMSAIKEAGYNIPSDIAVMGIDDAEEMLNGAFGLSSVKIPVADIAETAVRILIEEITTVKNPKSEKKAARHVLLTPALSIRQSTVIQKR